MRRFIAYGPSLIVLITASLTLVAAPAAIRQMEAARTAAQVTLAQQRLDQDDLLDRINQSVRDIAAAVEPSVIFVEARLGLGGSRFGRSTGSGWVYDHQGHIVTNAHVIKDARQIEVSFFDGRVRRADFIGMDESTDVAVIKIEPDPTLLFPARRASGGAVFQGDTVFAFGSPFGLKFSMSRGIVSGLGREALAGADRYTNFIQTDAAINPGNSGGPLVDVNGRVIGMNTAILADTEVVTPEDDGQGNRRLRSREVSTGSLGIGFAIPLETIESVVDQLVERGVVLKGFLGVSLQDLSPATGIELGFDSGAGVVLTDVMEGLPAAKGGLERDDIITHVDGRRTPNTVVLRSIISNRRPDAVVKITVWRDGEVLEKEVTLIAAVVGAGGQPIAIDHERLLASSPIEERRKQLVESLAEFGITRIEDGPRGAMIAEVREGSDAEGVGFRAGQQFTAALNSPVRDRAELIDALLPQLLVLQDNESPVIVVDENGRQRRLGVRFRD